MKGPSGQTARWSSRLGAEAAVLVRGSSRTPPKLPDLHPASRGLIAATSGPATEPIAHLIPDLRPVPVVTSFEGMGVLDKGLSLPRPEIGEQEETATT